MSIFGILFPQFILPIFNQISIADCSSRNSTASLDQLARCLRDQRQPPPLAPICVQALIRSMSPPLASSSVNSISVSLFIPSACLMFRIQPTPASVFFRLVCSLLKGICRAPSASFPPIGNRRTANCIFTTSNTIEPHPISAFGMSGALVLRPSQHSHSTLPVNCAHLNDARATVHPMLSPFLSHGALQLFIKSFSEVTIRQ